MESSKINHESDIIHRAIFESMEILKKDVEMWTRKGRQDIYRHAYTAVASKVTKIILPLNVKRKKIMCLRARCLIKYQSMPNSLKFS